ncbi:MAG: hypothetical protein NZ954_03645 [Thermofilaceae archaeon]|nr:hypothetical protein [Thermofilaceae archaeon]MCX8181366.1 hypothetical protein [Thermofilaceae archaeon]MDW8004674.1 hypothetical protein [Thermofilaceae archaeon]
MKLNEDEQRFLSYLSYKGGSAYLFEIRRALGLPHTSAWRMAKRLSNMGFIHTAKVKSGKRELLKVLLRRRT